MVARIELKQRETKAERRARLEREAVEKEQQQGESKEELANGSMNLELLTPDQRRAQRLLNKGRQRHTCLVGGSRSGKTTVLVRNIIRRALLFPGSRHVILRFRRNAIWPSIGLDTIPNVAKRFFPDLELTSHAHDYFSTPYGSEIWLGGLDDKTRTEKILGNEYATMYFNECSQIPYSSIVIGLTRLAQRVQGLRQRAYFDLNPTGKGHWSNQLFGELRDPISKRPLTDPDDYKREFLNPEGNKANLDPAYLRSLENLPERAKLRFYKGLYVDETENALWNITQLELCRRDPSEMPRLVRVVVAVDPSGAGDTLEGTHDAIGIVVVGVGDDGHAYVLDDKTILGGPNAWGKAAVACYHKWKADRIVGEVNFGGAMVEFVIRTVDPSVPFKAVTASRGKVVRAEPASSLYSNNKVHHVGQFIELEDEMCDFTDMGYVGQRSPNRADALVWALTELMLGENADGWLKHYEAMAAGKVGTPAVQAPKIIKPEDLVMLEAPGPHMNFAPNTGKRYTSNGKSIIENVHPDDVENLMKAGCKRVEVLA